MEEERDMEITTEEKIIMEEVKIQEKLNVGLVTRKDIILQNVQTEDGIITGMMMEEIITEITETAKILNGL